jgi:hypothetical protein
MRTEDAVRQVIGAFETANLVALGECHGVRQDSEFRLRLIEDPAFARSVNDIVVEFASALNQDLLDRFVHGGDVTTDELCKIWRNTSQPGAWDSPVYEEFLRAVRTANGRLPRGRRLRVVAGDPPIDWSAPGLRSEDIDSRDRFAAATIEREVLNKDRKALVLFGSGHLYRKRQGTIVELLHGNSKARWFIIIPVYEGASAEAVWVRLADSALGGLEANDVFEKGTRRVQFVDGKPVLVPARVFEEGVKMRDAADACVCFGGGPPEFVPAPAGLYSGTDYGREVQRRRSILMSLLPP